MYAGKLRVPGVLKERERASERERARGKERERQGLSERETKRESRTSQSIVWPLLVLNPESCTRNPGP